jgi:hypothetical protein
VTRRRSRTRTTRERQARSRSLNALSAMRRDDALPLSVAARRHGTTARTVRRLLPSAMYREPGKRRWLAKASDTYSADLEVLTAQGPRVIRVQGSRQRSIVGAHWAAVRKFLEGKGEADLQKYTGVVVGGYELLSDPEEIMELGGHGELDERDIYQFGGVG